LGITAACLGWEDNKKLLDVLADAVRKRRLKEEAEAEGE
jgi:3-deoxy-D-arabino-heptulosonate 7-phosphate (DAHP) synthase